MTIKPVDPLLDDRWLKLVDVHPRASVFHTPAWMRALRLTYGYKAVAFTTSENSDTLENGVLFNEVDSWLTGRRLVSAAFADHCQPLVNNAHEFHRFVAELPELSAENGYKYIEFRPIDSEAFQACPMSGLNREASYKFHALDLRPAPEALYRGLHSSCLKRKIRRAEAEALLYEEGRSQSILKRFYAPHVLTRRRQRLLAQPLAWFRNLADCFGEKLKIRVVSKVDEPVAAMITIRHQRKIVYKYGASNAQFHGMGGVPFLFWKTILDSKSLGIEELDLGRSDHQNPGLIQFKERLGARCSTLTYYRFSSENARQKDYSKYGMVREMFSHLPSPLYRAAGNALYKHVA